MKIGDFICAATHANFLNQAFGTNYKGWMKSAWKYNDDNIVWMVHFDKTNRGGWKNSFVSDNRIKEENVYGQRLWDGKPASAILLPYNRITFEIVDGNGSRKYVFKGVFKYDEENSNPLLNRYYDKVSDEF